VSGWRNAIHGTCAFTNRIARARKISRKTTAAAAAAPETTTTEWENGRDGRAVCNVSGARLPRMFRCRTETVSVRFVIFVGER